MGDLPSYEVQTLPQTAISEVISHVMLSVLLVGSDTAQKRESIIKSCAV